MPRTAIDYTKEILEKISSVDSTIFRKELRKAFRQLLPEERDEIKRWFRTACVCRIDHGADNAEPVPVRVN